MNACHELHCLCATLPVHHFPFVESRIPDNGIYILYESGEHAHGTHRIVRIGTHTGKDNLCRRIIEHFLTENKDRSIFRKHIGRALLSRAGDPFLEHWDIDLTTRDNRVKYERLVDLEKQGATEKEVTQYIQDKFSFVTLSVPDDQERKELETQLIGTVSSCADCQSSAQWLGRHHPNHRIASSGMWNIQGLHKPGLDQDALNRIREMA